MPLSLPKIDTDQINKYFYFFVFTLILLLITYVNNAILVTDDLIFDFYGEQLTYERIEELIENSDKWQWIIYPVLPIYYLLKFFIVAICLYIGILLAGSSVSFNKIFNVAMFSELVFLIMPIIKLVWFSIFYTDYTLHDLQIFSPLSLLSLINRESIELWLVYPLQVVNLFEVAYWLLLAYGLHRVTSERYQRMFELVASSYGLGLLLWTVFIVFLTVNAGG